MGSGWMNDIPETSTAHRSNCRVTAVLPVDIPHSEVRFARGIKAGNWVFATGQSGTDHVNGIAPQVLRSQHPLNGEPKAKREARRIYENIKEVLSEADSSIAKVVRVDQYYTSASVVDSYHEVRRETFGGKIPPSTSNLHRAFARRGQEIEVQAIAVTNDGPEVIHESFEPSYDIHHSSGYSPGLTAGEFRFIPGQTAEARDEREAGLDPLAQPSRGLWKGTPIKLETDFIIRHKMTPSLEGVGSGLDCVVKAQVYLRDQEDVPAFNEVWLSHFPEPPATTVIATSNPGFIIPESRIEINVIALARDGRLRRQIVHSSHEPLFDGWTSATRCGDLLFLSGLMAHDVPHANDNDNHFRGSQLKLEMGSIFAQAREICQAAGTSLANVVRIQQFHSNISDLPATIDQWADELDGAALPLSAIEVPWLPIPSARVLVDLWVYCPE